MFLLHFVFLLVEQSQRAKSKPKTPVSRGRLKTADEDKRHNGKKKKARGLVDGQEEGEAGGGGRGAEGRVSSSGSSGRETTDSDNTSSSGFELPE